MAGSIGGVWFEQGIDMTGIVTTPLMTPEAIQQRKEQQQMNQWAVERQAAQAFADHGKTAPYLGTAWRWANGGSDAYNTYMAANPNAAPSPTKADVVLPTQHTHANAATPQGNNGQLVDSPQQNPVLSGVVDPGNGGQLVDTPQQNPVILGTVGGTQASTVAPAGFSGAKPLVVSNGGRPGIVAGGGIRRFGYN
jgi:hypothetical protein